MSHICFEHLDYIGGNYPYECLICGMRHDTPEVREWRINRNNG